MEKDHWIAEYVSATEAKTNARTEAFCGMLFVVELAITHLFDTLVRKGVIPAEEKADWLAMTRERLHATRDSRSIDGQIGAETLLDCLEATSRAANLFTAARGDTVHLPSGRFQLIPGGLSR